MKSSLLCFACLLILSCHANNEEVKIKPAPTDSAADSGTTEWQRFHEALDSIYDQLPQVLKNNSMNSQWVIIAHLGIHSGLPRMALIDIKRRKIIDSGCVAHGYGNEAFSRKASFSNKPNSYCSSMGKYRIGRKYKGNFGLSYKLHGLDNTNSNAYARFIVLHAYECIPDEYPFPSYTCNSQGCPMISPHFLARLSTYIDTSDKPLLLWILSK
jgi:hypothetical protein